MHSWMNDKSKAGKPDADEVKQFAELYKGSNAGEKKAMVQKWLSAGGTKCKPKAFVSSIIETQNASESGTLKRMQLPGRIAELEGLCQEHFPTMGEFQAAIQELIDQNHDDFPPPEEMRTRPGKSFWSTRFHYFYDKGVSNTNIVKATQQISKESELSGHHSVETMELDVHILPTSNAAAAVADAPEPTAPPE
eukprot:595788-Amphidinium_carterae.1